MLSTNGRARVVNQEKLKECGQTKDNQGSGQTKDSQNRK
jgi:hypothetical protein